MLRSFNTRPNLIICNRVCHRANGFKRMATTVFPRERALLVNFKLFNGRDFRALKSHVKICRFELCRVRFKTELSIFIERAPLCAV